MLLVSCRGCRSCSPLKADGWPGRVSTANRYVTWPALVPSCTLRYPQNQSPPDPERL